MQDKTLQKGKVEKKKKIIRMEQKNINMKQQQQKFWLAFKML